MTIHEALEILHKRDSYAKGFGEAFDMAVEALEEMEKGQLKRTKKYNCSICGHVCLWEESKS